MSMKTWKERRAETEQFKVTGPVVGQGMTESMYSDAHSYTIIAISKSGKQITLQRDKRVLLNGVGSGEADALTFSPGGFVGHTSGIQRWATEPDTEGKVRKAYLNKLGRWRMSGSTGVGCGFVHPGRNEHYDHNF